MWTESLVSATRAARIMRNLEYRNPTPRSFQLTSIPALLYVSRRDIYQTQDEPNRFWR
jgi:hypothetical protein